MRFAKIFLSTLLLVGTLALSNPSPAQVAIGISVRIGPPLLPVYEQPLCPGEGYIWIPGYWAYGDDGYFWVPGTWVLPPEEGLLWTPGYWAWVDDSYVWYGGYWGPTVGFYGGINYGFGYPGVGFYGGYWRGGNYYYNRNVTNVNETIVHNTYNTTVVNNHTTINRVSFNGGPSGTAARPTSAEQTAMHQHHAAMTSDQQQHQRAASSNRALFASVNHGRPDVAATARPGDFSNRNAAPTLRKENENRPVDNRNGNRRDNRNEGNRPVVAQPPPNVRNREDRPPSANNPNPALMEKQQREQDRLRQQQDNERRKMDQKQAQEHQKLERHNTDVQRRQDLEQRHQQQAQQLQQKHQQQDQKLQQRQQQESQRQQSKPAKPDHPPHDRQ